MPIIDSDAHVIENEHTWDFMEGDDKRYRPVLLKNPDGDSARRGFWFIDRKVRGFGLPGASDEELAARSAQLRRVIHTPIAARELEDVGTRLRHMDELGIDIEVCHATLFIEDVAEDPRAEAAICRGWNRWMANAWKQGDGRIRWTCVLPTLTMSEALDELKWCAQNGACGIFMRPMEGNRILTDHYFDPLYDEASRLDIPPLVHIANSHLPTLDLLSNNPGGGFWRFRLPSVGAFQGLAASGRMQQFPKLRFGFVEAGSMWLPMVLRDLGRRAAGRGREMETNVLKDNRLYVACQMDDDIPYVLSYGTEDNILIGTDYGHTDQSSELYAIANLKTESGITEAQWRKIVDDNPRELFGETLVAQLKTLVAA
ncbi:MAG: amidohydrolase [Chloroflexi bacterium]|nr:amidohydrolase [Chloroflexota bacterium]